MEFSFGSAMENYEQPSKSVSIILWQFTGIPKFMDYMDNLLQTKHKDTALYSMEFLGILRNQLYHTGGLINWHI